MLCELAFAATVMCSEPAVGIDVDYASSAFVEDALNAGYHGVYADGRNMIYAPTKWARTHCLTDTDCEMVWGY